MTTTALRYHSAPQRRARILELVRARNHASVAELSEELGVSEMTIRRDIQRLDAEGAARAVRGGISLVPREVGEDLRDGTGTDFAIRAHEMVNAKRAIARAALPLLRSDTTIALDAGTTALELAMLLPANLHLSVVTASLPATNVLATRRGVELIGLGGVLHRESQAFAGPQTLNALQQLQIHQTFLAASGIRDGQVLCGNFWDAETKRMLVQNSEEVILLANSSKFDRSAMNRVAAMTAVRVLVVDAAISEQDRAVVEAAGIEVVVANDDVLPLQPAKSRPRWRDRDRGVGRTDSTRRPSEVPGTLGGARTRDD